LTLISLLIIPSYTRTCRIFLIGVKRLRPSNGIDLMKSLRILGSWMTTRIGMLNKEPLEKVGLLEL
jgi:hypothetical protein